MEVSIFPKVDHLLESFVEIRLKTDMGTEEEQAAKRSYQEELTGSLSLPIYVVLDPEKPKEYLDRFDGGDLGGKAFAEFLRRNIKTP